MRRKLESHVRATITYGFQPRQSAESVTVRATTTEFLDSFDSLLRTVMPGYQAEGRSYLTIAIGCTGGRHRSVAIVEEIAGRLRARGLAVRTTHRDENR